MNRAAARLLIPALAGVVIALGQTAPAPLTVRVQQPNLVQTVADGATLTFAPDAIGAPSDAAITLSYAGTTGSGANITSVELSGSTDFSLVGVPSEFPFAIGPSGPSLGLNVRYLPTSSIRNTARLTIRYAEPTRMGSITLNLVGVAPEFAFTYMVQPNGNAVPIGNGETIAFPPTAVGETATAVLTITNRGSGTGNVTGITASGERFQLAGLPLPPTPIEAGRDLRFNVRFTPRELEATSGNLRVEGAGRANSFTLAGSGMGPAYLYEVVQEGSASPVTPNQMLTVPDARVGQKSSLVIRVRNTGNAEGRISAINVTGAGFSLSELPFVPLTLAPGGASSFGLNYEPATPGRAVGRLRIGDDNFDVAANGLGANLAFSFASGAASFTVQNNGTVVFSPAAVGGTSSVQFTLANNGTAPAAINSISVTGPGFSATSVPATPMEIEPGSARSFTLNFRPVAVGQATATLRIDTQAFTLSGVGNQPAALPTYRFEGASGTVEPGAQPTVGIRLSEAYALPVSGTLTLAFNSEVFTSDPAVQFATGGRTVNFSIPAGSMQAVFPNNRTEIGLQSGTVAGTITLTPFFATTEGNIGLTPTNPPALNLVVPQSAPRLLNVQLSSKTASGITLLVTGLSTSRSITQMEFQFTPVSGENLSTGRVTLSVEPTFSAWYQGQTSQQYGSLFTATVPFTFQGNARNVNNLADTIQSVSVTLSNRQGVSQARSLELR